MIELNHVNIKPYKKCMGVYILQINNKNYIGSSVDLQRRLSTYIRHFLKLKCHNKEMLHNFVLNPIIKYEILEQLSSKTTYQQLLKRELKYINLLKPEYNIKICVQKDKPIKKIESFYCYDKNGDYLKQYDSFVSATLETNIHLSNIRAHLKKRRMTSLNFYWSLKKTNNILLDLNIYKKNKIGKYNLQGKLLSIYICLNDAVKEHKSKKEFKIIKLQILSCCRNEIQHVDKFVYKYIDVKEQLSLKIKSTNISRYPIIYYYDNFGNYVRSFKNILKAEKYTKIERSTIDRSLHNRVQNCKLGYFSHNKYKNIILEEQRNINFVFKYDLSGNYIKHYTNIKSAAQEHGGNKTYDSIRVAINNNCNNKRLTVDNNIYKYNTLHGIKICAR